MLETKIVTSEERMIWRIYPNSFTASRINLRLAVLRFKRELSKSLRLC
jgi:hypothetical protein